MANNNYNKEIKQKDCPQVIAAGYPGKFGVHNRNGTTLTWQEYKEGVVRDWVNHFRINENYHNTPASNKTLYLMQHLKNLNVKYKEAKCLLLKAERLLIFKKPNLSLKKKVLAILVVEVE